VWRVRAHDPVGGAVLGFTGIALMLLLAKLFFDQNR
jgi:hypothetical protein